MKPLATVTFGPEERTAVLEVLDSGRLTMGARVEAFERAYADWLGARFCVAVNSGSSAVLLMVAAWTFRHGPGRVIVPAIGWATSYSPFQQYGWLLVFVDVDRETLNYDVDVLRRTVTDLTRWTEPLTSLLLAIHLLGNPNDMAALSALGLPILEDNCEAMGAVYAGKKTGTFGVMAAHSTYFSHHLSTIEGGMVTTDDEYFYHLLLALRSHGWTRHLPAQNQLGVVPDTFSFILPGYNVRPTEIQGALGLAQLPKLDGFIAQRRDNAARFPFKTQREIGESSWFSLAVFGDDRKRFTTTHETRPCMSGNFVRQPCLTAPLSPFARYRYVANPRGAPSADWVEDNVLLIGNSPTPIDWEV